MIKKFDCLVDKDEAVISWSSSDTEDSTYSDHAKTNQRDPVKKNLKRKSTKNSCLPSAKLRIRETDLKNSTSKSEINKYCLNNELFQSPLFHCTSSVKSKEFSLKEECVLSPILKSHNLNLTRKNLSITSDHDDCVSPILNTRNNLIEHGRKDLKSINISSPLVKKYSALGENKINALALSTNSEFSSTILSCTQNFNRGETYYDKSPILKTKDKKMDYSTMMDNINISPLLNRTIIVNGNINNAKKKLFFDETKTNKIKNEFDSTKPGLFENGNDSTGQSFENLPKHNHKQLFKKFSFKSEPCSQQSIDNNMTPEFENLGEVKPSQVTIRSFTPTNEETKSTGVEIITVSSPSVVEFKLEQSDVQNHALSLSNLLLDSTKSKKKRLKRDGLAYRLQNALKSRKSALSIWKHEIFLAANSNFDMPLNGEPLNLKVLESSQQYGVVILNCLQTIKDIKYILILNKSLVQSDGFKRGLSITIFKPYDIHRILEKENYVNVILNASKINI